MGDYYSAPNRGQMQDNESWAKYFGSYMQNPGKALRTSSSIAGTTPYVATSSTISDILQGTFNFRNPSEAMSTTNVALTRRLQQLDTPGLMQVSILGKDSTTVSNTAGSDGAGESPGVTNVTEPVFEGINTPEDVMYAGNLLINHPNFWSDTESLSDDGKFTTDGSGGYAKGLVNQLTNGFALPASVADRIAIKTKTKGFVAPNLINLLWFIVENGFIIGRNIGMVGVKNTDKGSISNHSFGCAIDVGRIGRAKESVTYEVSDTRSHSIIRELYQVLDTLPSSRFPGEIGGPFDPGNGAKGDGYYTDAAHSNHLHLGFYPENAGSLLSVLLSPSRKQELSTLTSGTSDVRSISS